MHGHHDIKMVEDVHGLIFWVSFIIHWTITMLCFGFVAKRNLLVVMVASVVLSRAWQIIQEQTVAVVLRNELLEPLHVYNRPFALAESETLVMAV